MAILAASFAADCSKEAFVLIMPAVRGVAACSCSKAAVVSYADLAYKSCKPLLIRLLEIEKHTEKACVLVGPKEKIRWSTWLFVDIQFKLEDPNDLRLWSFYMLGPSFWSAFLTRTEQDVITMI